MNCRYYTERTLGWMLNNKLIVFLGLLSFCLFVSTLALAGEKRILNGELDDLRASLTSTTEPSETTTDAITTEAATTVVPTETEVTVPTGVETDTVTTTDPTAPDAEDTDVPNPGGSLSNPDEISGENQPVNDQEPTPISVASNSKLLKVLGSLA